ncbi:hypothetical protein LCGC14_0434210 [marine sediment metagenome]|uniref:AP2/ERF domain-containing protein n=1 Tax=marine sediment metagenome TaxID=412755 RepID=A0A0F9V947_9ZZZZ
MDSELYNVIEFQTNRPKQSISSCMACCPTASGGIISGAIMSKKISLTQGKFAIVDDGDYEELSKHKWCATKGRSTYYARRAEYREYIYMHRQILSQPDGILTDHRDGNGLNNTRDNLRICTKGQNSMNQRPQKGGSSCYKGVSWHKARGKWHARIELNQKTKHLGIYDNEIEAAKAYDNAASELFGEFAYTNF